MNHMLTFNVIMAFCLLSGAAGVSRAALRSAPRAGRSFLVPFGVAGLMVLGGLVMTSLVLVQARALNHW